MYENMSTELLAVAERVQFEKPRPVSGEVTFSELDIGQSFPLHVKDNRSKCPGRPQFGRSLVAVHLSGGMPIYAGMTIGNLTPDEGENLILDMLVGSQAVITPLYLNLHNVPALASYAESDTYQADVTLVSGGAYGAKTLTRGTNWTITAPAGATQAEADQQTWTASGGAFSAANGVIVCTAATTASGFVIWQQDLSVQRTLQDGDQLQVTFTAQLTLES
jgi:hypothetical protein